MKKKKNSKVVGNMSQKHIHKSKRKGFSLVETLIAVFVFALLITMLAGTFSGFLKNLMVVKKTQRNTESAQYAINIMAKTIRTSIVSPSFVSGEQQITMFDISSSQCVIYKHENEVLKIAKASGAGIADVSKCNVADAPALDTFSDLTKQGELSGVSFSGSPSVDPTKGKITIVASVMDGDASQGNSLIQSTVSLRQ